MPVVIGLGASSLLWYWLFSYDFGLVNRALIDLGVIAKPVVWFGEDADVALWAVIVSIVWKVLGFGMLLFVAAIQAIPQEITEAAMVDGASYWQRVRRITLPLTARTILLVTLFSVIGSLLAFDQFYLMTAGQPRNLTATSVFWIYLNSFPYLKLGYGAALSLILAAIILACTVVQMMLTRRTPRLNAIGHAPATERRAGACRVARRRTRSAASSCALGRAARNISRARSASRSASIMLLPLVAFGAGFAEDDGGGGRDAADLLPARPEPRQLCEALELPGRPADLSLQQRGHGAPDHRLLPRADHSGRLCAGALPRARQGSISSSSCCSR